MSQKPSKRLRLKAAHPTLVKLNKVLALAEELGIYVSADQFVTRLHDEERPEITFFIEDADHNGEPVSEFPPTLEFNVFMDNPAYLEYERQEREKHDREQAEALQLAEERRRKLRDEAEARHKAAELAAAKELERQERAELARLKEKFKE